MLRLVRGERSINPALIECVVVVRTDVVIGIPSEPKSITVIFKTEEDAIDFGEYVELLVDISNTGETEDRRKAVADFELYFENYLIPRAQGTALRRVRKHLNERHKAEKRAF